MNERELDEFLQRALKVLEDHPSTKYCNRCWGQAAGMTSPEALQRLSAHAATFVKSPDHIEEHGTCTMCGKDTWVVSKLR